MSEAAIRESFDQDGLAYRAMEEAQRANARVDGHEAVCAERYKSIDNTMKAVLASVKGLWKIVVVTAGALIAGMGTILAHQIFYH